jgi:hypothetical protein
MEGFFKVRAVLAVIVLLAIATFKSCEEARYTLWGETVEPTSATTRQVTTRGRRGSQRQKLEVSYQFDDAGKVRKEHEVVSLDYKVPDPLRVQYIPGTTDSRIEGNTERFWLIIVAIALALFSWQVIKFWKFYKS